MSGLTYQKYLKRVFVHQPVILKRSTNDSNFLENVMQYQMGRTGQGTYVLSSLWAGESGKGGEKVGHMGKM